MDISHIKTFIEVSRTRHFGKAAQALFITQSAVSARVRMLEEALGVRLLTRERNNIQLTAAGQRFLPLAEQISTTWNLARQTTGLEEESKTLLTIGGVYSLWESGMQSIIFDYFSSSTNIAVNLIADTGDHLLRSIIEGNIDVGLMYEQPQLKSLSSLPAGNLDLVLVSTNATQSLSEAMQDDSYVYVNWGTEFAMTHAKEFPDIPTPNMRVDFARIALDFLCENGGSAYLAKSMIIKELDNGTLHLIQNAPSIKRDFYLVYKEKNAKTDSILALQSHFNRFNA